MSSTRAEAISSHAVSPLSIFGAGAAAAAGAVAGAWAQRSPAATSATAAISRIVTVSGNALIAPCPPWSTRSERALVALTGADPDGRVHGMDEDLTVADVPRLGRGGQDARDLVGQAVRYHHLHLDLRQEVHGVLAASIQLGVALLATEPANLRNRHADDADARQRLLDVVELERLDDSLDFFHGPSRGGLACTCHAGVTVLHSGQIIEWVVRGGRRCEK